MLVVVGFVIVFCFFKQKTAYEMRISDWSSDVCSSDLNEMFDLGADLATPPDIQFGFGPHDMALRIVPSQIARLEDEIDAMNDALDALKSFIDRKSVV